MQPCRQILPYIILPEWYGHIALACLSHFPCLFSPKLWLSFCMFQVANPKARLGAWRREIGWSKSGRSGCVLARAQPIRWACARAPGRGVPKWRKQVDWFETKLAMVSPVFGHGNNDVSQIPRVKKILMKLNFCIGCWTGCQTQQ